MRQSKICLRKENLYILDFLQVPDLSMILPLRICYHFILYSFFFSFFTEVLQNQEEETQPLGEIFCSFVCVHVGGGEVSYFEFNQLT